MIVTLDPEISGEQRQAVLALLAELGIETSAVRTQDKYYLVGAPRADFDLRRIGHLPGVRDVHRVSDPYKLVSRKWKAEATRISLGSGVELVEGGFSIVAGPCSIESEEQILAIVAHLKEQGIRIMRGGAFKPRSSPYSFRGLGLEGLKLFYKSASDAGIKVVSEVLAASQIGAMYDYVDVYQVGTRNSQNFDLLHELGTVDKPVLLKRGMSGTVEELLQSAEYVFSNGNERLILCERGIRTFERAYRNVLDLNAVPALKQKTHLPVMVDPSHGVGVRRWIEPMALAAIMAGADGLLIEIHPEPNKAMSDGQQTLNFAESARLVRRAQQTFALRSSFEAGDSSD